MLPSLMRASWRLWRARRALLDGRPECALRWLADPALVLSRRADWLRGRTLDQLCRQAAERARLGRDGSVARILDMVEAEDPELAERQRARLGGAEERTEARAEETRRALRELLGELRGGSLHARDPDAREPDARAAHSSPEGERRPAEAGDGRGADARAPLRLSIDDAGELLVVRAGAHVLGHRRNRALVLGFLADLEPEHARLALRESLHEGPAWTLEPLAGEVLVDDERVREARVLADGARVRLARNLAFRFRFPDAASASAALELEGGLECGGATRVLLLASGAGGRARVGRAPSCHLVAPRLEHELWLLLEREDELSLGSSAGLRVVAPAARAGAAAQRIGLRLPLREPLALELGERRPGSPPTGLFLRAEGEGAA